MALKQTNSPITIKYKNHLKRSTGLKVSPKKKR